MCIQQIRSVRSSFLTHWARFGLDPHRIVLVVKLYHPAQRRIAEPVVLPLPRAPRRHQPEPLAILVRGECTVAEIEKQLELLKGDVLRGQQVFVDARCASCHKVGNIGSSVGPDLNVVSGRFTRREILEAIVHPSQVISDQYRSSVIQTEDGKVRTGIVSTLPGAKIAILDSEGNRTEISRLDVEAVSASDQSIMPARLLENFNAQQVVDLIRFLESEDRPTIASADQTGEADGETRR